MSLRNVTRALLALAAFSLPFAPAHAQLFRAYLSPTGSDANPCTLPAPCRLLPAALAAVAGGGEIWMLDSANYNTATVTIGKSVSILAVPGAVGSVVATGGPAISIATPGLTVSLRNLVIVPLPSSGATDGIFMNAGSTLTIEKSLIANLPGAGVYAVGSGKVKITDSTIRSNGTYAATFQDGVDADVLGAKMLDNVSGGIFAFSTASAPVAVSVTDSIVSNGSEGFIAVSSSATSVAKIFATRCTIKSVGFALDSEVSVPGGSSLIVVSGSMVTGNGYGWFQSGAGAVIRSLGNNDISDNPNTFGALTTASTN